jgi:hypothetical protein
MRRLTGDFSAAADWRREQQAPAVDRETSAARDLLSALLGIAAAANAGQRVDPAGLTALAEQALAVDPASELWQQVAHRLTSARDDAAAGRPIGSLADAIGPVLDRARRGARPEPNPGTRAPGTLRSTWSAESRR